MSYTNTQRILTENEYMYVVRIHKKRACCMTTQKNHKEYAYVCVVRIHKRIYMWYDHTKSVYAHKEYVYMYVVRIHTKNVYAV